MRARAKHLVEEQIRSAGIRHTILAPVYLMWHSYAGWVDSLRSRFREFCPHPVPVGP